MRGIRYTAEFKAEAIKQITERGYSAVDVAKRLDFTEQDFIAKLVQEINDKSGVNFNSNKLDDVLIQALLKAYSAFGNDDEMLLEALGDAGIIKRNNDFKEGALTSLKPHIHWRLARA